MTNKSTVKKERPADFLSAELLKFPEYTQKKISEEFGVSRLTVNEILKGRRGITPIMAAKFAKLLGIDALTLLNLQMYWDLYNVHKNHQNEIDKITPLQEFVPDGHVAKRIRRNQINKIY